jgi:hypothetical protein
VAENKVAQLKLKLENPFCVIAEKSVNSNSNSLGAKIPSDRKIFNLSSDREMLSQIRDKARFGKRFEGNRIVQRSYLEKVE